MDVSTETGILIRILGFCERKTPNPNHGSGNISLGLLLQPRRLVVLMFLLLLIDSSDSSGSSWSAPSSMLRYNLKGNTSNVLCSTTTMHESFLHPPPRKTNIITLRVRLLTFHLISRPVQLVLFDHLLCRHLTHHIRCRLGMVAAVAIMISSCRSSYLGRVHPSDNSLTLAQMGTRSSQPLEDRRGQTLRTPSRRTQTTLLSPSSPCNSCATN